MLSTWSTNKDKTKRAMLASLAQTKSMKLSLLFQRRSLLRHWFRYNFTPTLANASAANNPPVLYEPSEMGINFDALYEEQANDRKGDFRGKRKQIGQHYHDFWSRETARADVEAYMNSEQETVYKYRDAGEKMPTLEKNRLANPEDKRLAKGDGFFIISVTDAFDVALYPHTPGRSAMSIVHLLAIPEARVFNGVSLTHADASTVEAMMTLFRERWSSRAFREAVLKEQWKALERRRLDLAAAVGHGAEAEGMGTGTGLEAVNSAFARAAANYHRLAPVVLDDLAADDFAFGLHLYPDQSQPHLHVHIVAAREDCRRYSTSKHDAKTVDAREVLDFIRSPEASAPWTSSSRRAK